MSAALQLVEPDTTELQAKSSALVLDAQALTIVDDATFSAAAEFMNGCADLRKEIVSKFADAKKKADEAHKAICALEKTQLEPVAVAKPSRRSGSPNTAQSRSGAQPKNAAVSKRSRRSRKKIAGCRKLSMPKRMATPPRPRRSSPRRSSRRLCE
jgi:hypothetical protein